MGCLPHRAACSGAWGLCCTARPVGAWALAAQRDLFRCMGSLPHSAVRNPLGQDATRAKASKNMEPPMHTDAHRWTRTSAAALLTMRGRLGSALNAHAGLRPIRVHLCASVVPSACLPYPARLHTPTLATVMRPLGCSAAHRAGPVLVHGVLPPSPAGTAARPDWCRRTRGLAVARPGRLRRCGASASRPARSSSPRPGARRAARQAGPLMHPDGRSPACPFRAKPT